METIWSKHALLDDGWREDVRIAVDSGGRIASVETGTSPGGKSVDLLLPAPVNAHSHAFQRAMAGLTESRGAASNDSFWTWRQLMYRFLERITPEHVEAIAAWVQLEMLEAGYGASVEFHYLHHQPDGRPYNNLAELSERVAAAANQTGIGLTLLPVHYQFGGCDQRPLGAGQIRFGNELDRFFRLHAGAYKAVSRLSPDCNCGVAPHSLRAVAPDDLHSLAALIPDGPVHMHIAEQDAEVAEVSAAWGKRPVEWLLDNVPVDARWCLIHCTQMLAHETEKLAKSQAVAGLCPITESSLGDGIFDGVNWLAHGGRIAIGSDSNIRISLAEEMRTLEYSQRLRDRSRAALARSGKSTGRRIFDAICAGGAQAANRESGSIAPGRWADLIGIDLDHPDLWGKSGDVLLDSWIFAGSDRMIRDVWSAGRHCVRDGRHVGREQIRESYISVIRELGALI